MLYDEVDSNGVLVKSSITLGMLTKLGEGNQWVPHVVLLPDAKIIARQNIDGWRDTACAADVQAAVGGITYAWQADKRSQDLLSSTISLVGLGIIPAPAVWRSSDNINVAVTLADLHNIATAMAGKTSWAYSHSWDLKASVDAATTVDQVNAITW